MMGGCLGLVFVNIFEFSFLNISEIFGIMGIVLGIY